MLRIGVTGHRILAETEKIIDSIDVVLQEIMRSFPADERLILSSLAEGADCLFVEKALLLPNTFLQAVLPLPPVFFWKTFLDITFCQKAKSFLTKADAFVIPPQPTAELAYHIAGQYVVKHADVLVAIWDGNPPQGIGGAGDVVALARDKKLPLAWIKAGNRLPGTYCPTTLGREQGSIVFENFPWVAKEMFYESERENS